MNVNIGDVFWLTVTYPGMNKSERRPVVIYGFDNNTLFIASFAAITSSNIKNYGNKYDKWKSPIFKWEEAGLSKPSYVKANNIATIDKGNFKKKDYIGKMNNVDLENAKRKISEFLQSNEDS